MRAELRATYDRLVAALAAHVEAAEDGTRPDIPDPLPAPTAELAAALRDHADELERLTGAIVPWEVVEPGPASRPGATAAPDEDDPDEDDGDVDWVDEAQRWR